MNASSAYAVLLAIALRLCAATYHYETKYIQLPVDHFSFANNATFKLRYLYNDTYWQTGGPIFIYAGNEGGIETFAQNSGFIWELAPEFNGLLVFAEHRYYGDSMPFGNGSFSDLSRLGYLTSAQAMADYVYLLDYIQEELKTKNGGDRLKAIAFGGSYGGMLAAWMRLKYPGSVFGAYASSAPIFQFKGLTKCSLYKEVIASVYKSSSDVNCVRNIKKSWSTIREVTANDDGKAWLSSTFKLCEPLKAKEHVDKLIGWIDDVYSAVAMINYPYPTSFLAPTPAYPVKALCDKFSAANLTGKPLLSALTNALTIYTNYTGQTKCINTNVSIPTMDETAWDFQSCTEMVMPICAEKNEMYEDAAWNFTQYASDCRKKFGVKLEREDLAILEYGGREALYTNIIFTNGLLDPWSSGGFLQSTTSAIAILIPDSAHHLELRDANDADPPTVIATRKQIRSIFNSWLQA